jgi:hypothetical protein
MICADHLVLLVCHEVKEDEMSGACSMFGERRGNIRVLLVKHGGKALPRRRKLGQDTVQRILSK